MQGPKKPGRTKFQAVEQRAVPGILMNRERPAGSGWCGKEDCGHYSHKFYNAPARKVKK